MDEGLEPGFDEGFDDGFLLGLRDDLDEDGSTDLMKGLRRVKTMGWSLDYLTA